MNVKDSFAKVNLPFKILDHPLTARAGMDRIFQIDINNNSTRSKKDEWYEAFIPANENVEVAIVDVSPKHQQVLL